VLTRYDETKCRETAKKVGKTKNLKFTDGVYDTRFNRNDKIDQFQLLRHFISAVVVLNPVWDIGLQNTMLSENFYNLRECPLNMSLAIHCPCSKKFKKWRESYPTEYGEYDLSIDKDKSGFCECQAGTFESILEFYKHLAAYEKKCYYHEAMIDILSVMYPALYQCAIEKKKNHILENMQKITSPKKSVRSKLQIMSSLNYFTVYR